MSSDWIPALEAIADRLLSLAAQDEGLRASLHRLALAVLEATEPAEIQNPAALTSEGIGSGLAEPASQPQAKVTGVDDLSAEATTGEESISTREPLPELTFARAGSTFEPAVQQYSWYPTELADFDLTLMENRCRLKAEAARWAATRRRLMAHEGYSTDVAQKDNDIISRAKALPDCFLWMSNRDAPSPADLSLYEHVAGCFENVANLLSLIRQISDKPALLQEEFEKCLDLTAEAQSALRVGIGILGAKPDTDQGLAYRWLKFVTKENQIFVQRFMRLDDPADFANWSELATRIEAAEARIREVLDKEKRRTKLLGKIRHKANQILESPNSADANWPAIVPIIDELITNGLPPSNVELREHLAPILETMPELPDLPRNVELAFREIDRYLAAAPPSDSQSPAPPSAQVQEVARLLNGKAMVIIGGERRPSSCEALKNAFQLQELIWIETREHESISGFEPKIARPDVHVVVLAIRWSSHSHGEAQTFCDKYGKPLVRLPAGYHPNQVAEQILTQCSHRLRGSQRFD